MELTAPAPVARYRSLAIWAKVTVSVICVAIALWSVEPRTIAAQFENQNIGWVLGAASVTALQIILGAFRWDQILKALGGRVPTRTVFVVTYVGSFFNSWLLGLAAGDAARALLVPTRLLRRTLMIYSVILDRVFALVGLALVICPSILLDMGPFARSAPLALSLLVATCPLAILMALDFGARRMEWIRRKLPGPILSLCESWHLMVSKPMRLAIAIVLSIIGQIAISVVVYCLARAQGLTIPFFDLLLLMPPVVLLTVLPISIGGWGVRETAMVASLGLVSVSPNAALLISLQMGALAGVLSLPGGGVWLLRYGSMALANRRKISIQGEG